MDSLLAATPPVPPHYHEHTRLSPSRSMSTPSSSRKRKASPSPGPDDDPMSTSPALSSARLPTATPRSIKRSRPNLNGKPLTVPRLLETLDKDALRGVLSSLFQRHPELKEEILHLSPRPSIPSTLQVLRQYQSTLNSSFPLSENPRSDYSYNRVRGPLMSLLDALNDFTPHFLPPNQPQSSTSLTYLDGVTQIIHDLPRWDSVQHNLIKENAYDEIAGAWICVIKEASKRGGGIQLQHGDWENKLRRHNELSGGRLYEVTEELRMSLGWMGSGYGSMESHHAHTGHGPQLIRQQLISGTYGSEFPAMRTGAW